MVVPATTVLGSWRARCRSLGLLATCWLAAPVGAQLAHASSLVCDVHSCSRCNGCSSTRTEQLLVMAGLMPAGRFAGCLAGCLCLWCCRQTSFVWTQMRDGTFVTAAAAAPSFVHSTPWEPSLVIMSSSQPSVKISWSGMSPTPHAQ